MGKIEKALQKGSDLHKNFFEGNYKKLPDFLKKYPLHQEEAFSRSPKTIHIYTEPIEVKPVENLISISIKKVNKTKI